MSQTVSEIVFEARAITKRYPGTIALKAVNFRVYRNQVNVLIGENGAGKSTLMRILAGVERADEGELALEGSPIEVRSPRQAAALGISIVHQELSVLPNLNIAENVFAGREPVRAGVFVHRALQDWRSSEALRRLGKSMAVRTLTGHLSLGCRQIVEVARALDQGAKILILDEPTSALSSPESESLFRVIEELKRSGVTVIYISHRLNELLYLGDRFTVLRSGQVVGEAARAEVSRKWIVERMSARDATAEYREQATRIGTPTLLQLRGVSLANVSASEPAQAVLHNVSLTLRRGEILGIYGLLGSGRTELLELIAGLRRVAAGTIELAGKTLRISDVVDAVKAGICLVPEDRQSDGLIADMSIRENIALCARRGLFLDRALEGSRVGELIADLRINAADMDLPVTTLSGGNQQKVLIARCLMRSPSVLLLDEPTRGVDVGAKAEIHAILHRLAEQGVGVIFTSSEIEETQALSDRALVLCQGRIAAEFDRSELSDDALFAAASPAITGVSVAHSGASLA